MEQKATGGMRHSNLMFFKNADLDIYVQAFMGYQSYGGASTGEVFYVIKQIDEKDPQTWTRAWQDMASLIQARGEQSLAGGHVVSAREAFLRAYTYYRISTLTLPAYDERFRQTWETMVACYQQAMSLFEPPIESVHIPFQECQLPSYYMRPDESETPKPTIIVIGGGETYVEDNYFWGGAAGLLRGYNVLAIDMPGQGATAFQGMHHRADTEKSIEAVLDWLAQHPEVDMQRIGIVGVSLGGYIVTRAAGFEPRIKACAASTPIHDFYKLWSGSLPAALRNLPSFAENTALKLAGLTHPYLPIAIDKFYWQVGVTSFKEAANAMRDWQVPVEQITCPVLCMVGEGEDEGFKVQAEEFYERLTSPKVIHHFTKDSGADAHSQANNYVHAHQVLYDWFDTILK